MNGLREGCKKPYSQQVDCIISLVLRLTCVWFEDKEGRDRLILVFRDETIQRRRLMPSALAPPSMHVVPIPTILGHGPVHLGRPCSHLPWLRSCPQLGTSKPSLGPIVMHDHSYPRLPSQRQPARHGRPRPAVNQGRAATDKRLTASRGTR